MYIKVADGAMATDKLAAQSRVSKERAPQHPLLFSVTAELEWKKSKEGQ